MSEAALPAGFTRLLSDERLTRRAVEGDERAFTAIFCRYHQPLYRFCLAIVGNPEDAQDALQNTMAKVLRALPGEERKIELKPWLYRIAHNESIDLLRRRRETRELDAEQPAPGYGLAEDAATRERLRNLLADLRELPERQREVLVMREIAGLDFEEIGTTLETSGAVARQTLYEARQSLRQMEEGREMSCDVVTRALSDGDGRVTRRRDVRAHLRTCAACRSFREEIESREHSFAALSPLPAVAAAGMLQGLLGGSQAATGGGLAALLGGGAAQTVGVSAAAKGVATVAVVAAVGVTAADRSGVIHLGLPGEGGTKSSTAEPGAGGAAPAANPGVDKGHAVGAAQEGKAGDEGSKKSMSVDGSGAAKAATPAQGEGASAVKAHGLEKHPRSPQADSKAQGPPVAHGGGGGREAQHPEAAAKGQETAAEHVPPLPEAGAGEEKGAGGEKGEAPVNTPKAAPAPSQGSPSKEAPPKSAPTSPPAAKPESPPQSQSQPKAEAPAAKPAAPPAPASPGKGAEQGKGAKSAEAGSG
jgi:RNA polymerase sigma factor (sigma-70 family)